MQVLVRQKEITGKNTALLLADVVKSEGANYIVKVDGERNVRSVAAAETLPLTTLFPGQARLTRREAIRSLPTQCPTPNRRAIVNMF